MKQLLVLLVAILCCVLLSAEAKNVQNLKRTVSKTVRSDALNEAISLIDEYGQVKGYQLPMRAFKRKQNDVTRGYSITYQQDYTRAAWGIPIQLGSGQPFYVDVDTGSSDLLVAGQFCTNCITGTYYSPSSTAVSQSCGCAAGGCSTVSGTNYCTAKDCYGDGSGAYSISTIDNFGIPGVPFQVNATFGNIYQSISSGCGTGSPVTGNQFFVANWTGLFGVAYSNLASLGASPLPLDQLLAANNLPAVFSLCTSTSNPYMSLGVDYYNCSGSLFTYVPITTQSYFVVSLDDAGVGTSTFGLSNAELNFGGTIIDSGTTFLVLNYNLSQPLWNSFLAKCSGGGPTLVGVCGVTFANSIFGGSLAYTLTAAQLQAYPDLYFTFGGYQVVLTPKNYLLPTTVGGNTYFGAISMFSASQNIFGDTLMSAVHVVFDKSRSKLGFGPLTSCNLASAGTCVAAPTTTTGGASTSSTSSSAASSLSSPLSLLL